MDSPTTLSLKDQLRAALTVAMKARDEVALSSLRQAIAAISVAETAGDEVVELTDEQTAAVVATEARKHHESADAFAVAGRHERVERARAEAAVIEAYLPAALGEDELRALVDIEVAAAAADGIAGMKAMGRVVSAVRAKAGPTADGSAIAALVKSALG
jgi:uncharacterized protein